MTNPEPADLPISLLINGQRRELRVPPWLTLLDLLRERLDLVAARRAATTANAALARCCATVAGSTPA